MELSCMMRQKYEIILAIFYVRYRQQLVTTAINCTISVVIQEGYIHLSHFDPVVFLQTEIVLFLEFDYF